MRRAVFIALLAGAAVPVAGAGAPLLPDLVSDPPVHSHLEVRASTGPTPARLLLRMDGYVHNVGPGPLDIAGNPAAGQVFQRVADDQTGAFSPRRPVTLQFENSDGHNHWHLMAASEYSLWDLGRTRMVAPADKIGFCLYDMERVETTGPVAPVYDDNVNQLFCRADQPAATSIRMGVSRGWRDLYAAYLELQWVDVSDTQPGEYVLASRANPQQAVDEINPNNGYGFAARTSIVPGYVARPVGPVAVTPGEPAVVTLGADAFSRSGEPGAQIGARRFRVASAPHHGTLSVTAGSAFAGPQVTYAPLPGYVGTDSFSYEAFDAASQFPRTPARAAVTLTVGTSAPAVVISGAPAQLVAGTAVQLTATVTGGSPVVWSVNGVDGGSAAVGTISPGGRYVAPATPPAAPVTISARTTTVPPVAASATVTIIAAGGPEPLPNPSSSGRAEPLGTGTVRVTRPRVAGGRVTVQATAPTRGLVRIRVRNAARTLLLECILPASRNRPLACDRKLRPGWSTLGLRASAQFVSPTSLATYTRPQIEVRNGFLMARTTAGRTGMVTLDLTRRGVRLMRCTARASAGRDVSCSVRAPNGVRRSEIGASVTHRSARGSVSGRY